jgi:hypothetical protein
VEAFVGRPVFLKCEVKVRAKWMEDEEMLGRAGLLRTMIASSDLAGASLSLSLFLFPSPRARQSGAASRKLVASRSRVI